MCHEHNETGKLSMTQCVKDCGRRKGVDCVSVYKSLTNVFENENITQKLTKLRWLTGKCRSQCNITVLAYNHFDESLSCICLSRSAIFFYMFISFLSRLETLSLPRHRMKTVRKDSFFNFTEGTQYYAVCATAYPGLCFKQKKVSKHIYFTKHSPELC